MPLRTTPAGTKSANVSSENEDLFRKIVEHAPIAMAIVGMDGVIEFINQKAVSVFGYLPEDIPTMDRWWVRAYPDKTYRTEVVADWTGRVRKALTESKEIAGNEYRVTCKDGAVKTMFISGIPAASRIFVLFDDISERKRAESQRESAIDALRLRESYLSAIIENQPGLLWMKDREGRFLAVNTQFAVSCGLNDPELLVGKTDFDIWPRELAAGYVADDDRVLRTKKPCTVEEPISDKGDVRWFETFKTPIVDKQGTVIGTTGYSRDITERKKAEDALLASELKYRELANTVPIGIFECGVNGEVIFSNSVLHAWFGYTRADVQAGMNVIDFVDARDRERAKKNMAGALVSPSPQPNEYRAVRKDGSTMQVLIISQPLIANGRMAGFRGILLDLTEKKIMEAAIQNAARLESLGVLAGGIAHDFNNLLTGIFGYIDLARSVTKEAKAVEFLDATLHTMDRARSLTQQLLTFAKGGAPAKKTEPLADFLQETVRFALSGSTVSCRFAVPAGLRPASFDRNQIGRVIDNIIINAQQAMPMGGVIEVSAANCSIREKEHAVLAQGDYVKVSIKDHGIGIPPEILLHIFDPFFTTKTQGHGLGLATCYSILHRHGGAIEVESEQGKGSTFHFYLPAAAGPVSSITNGTPAGHKGTGTIIIMDDEKVLCDTIAAMLATFGYSVLCAKNGKEAVDLFVNATKTSGKIAGIILDLTVPGGMGGRETVAMIRKSDREIPVFVASGYADDPVMANPESYGFTASICKPFILGELAAMLNKHLK